MDREEFYLNQGGEYAFSNSSWSMPPSRSMKSWINLSQVQFFKVYYCLLLLKLTQSIDKCTPIPQDKRQCTGGERSRAIMCDILSRIISPLERMRCLLPSSLCKIPWKAAHPSVLPFFFFHLNIFPILYRFPLLTIP